MRYTRLWSLLLVLIMTASFIPGTTGCTKAESPLTVTGVVELDNPIKNATVSIYDTRGKLLHREKQETTATGVFILQIRKALPADFRIEATSGVDSVTNEPLSIPMAAEIRGYTKTQRGFYYLGPASTLLAAYLKANPNMAYETAKTKVNKFLGLHPDTNVLRDLMFEKDRFNDKAFVIEANKAGGVSKYIPLLVTQVDTPTTVAYNFTSSALGQAPVQGVAGTVAKWILLKLAEGAVNKVGGEACGWVIDQIVGGNGSDAAMSELARQSEKLDQISNQITVLGRELKDALQKLTNLVEYNSYQTLVGQLGDPIAYIQTMQDEIAMAAGKLDPKIKEEREEAQRIIDSIDENKVKTAITQIHNALLPSGAGTQGLLDLYGRMEIKKSWGIDKYSSLETQFGYFARIQLAALNLLVEKYHAQERPSVVVDEAIKKYKANIEAQGDLFLSSVESLLAWNVMGGIDSAVYQKEFNFFWYSHVPGFPKDVIVSSTLKKADQTLADFMGGNPPLLIIRVYNSTFHDWPYGARPDLNDSRVQLNIRGWTGTNWFGEVYNGTKKVVTVTSPPIEKVGLRDGPKNDLTAQVARFTFENKAPANYKIVDDSRTLPKYGTGAKAVSLIRPFYLDQELNIISGDDNILLWGWLVTSKDMNK